MLVEAPQDIRFKRIEHSAALDTKDRLYLLKPGPLLQQAKVQQNFINVSLGETVGFAVDS